MRIIIENNKHFLVPIEPGKIIRRKNDIKGLYDTKKLCIPNQYTLEECHKLFEVIDIED